MPNIFDNIDKSLLPALTETLKVSNSADFCVGYFNLRGWKQIDDHIEKWTGGEGNACRLIVGMHKSPDQSLQEKLSAVYSEEGVDLATMNKMKKSLAEEFRNQLALGIPTNADEAGLRRLARQIRAQKVIVKLFLKHSLHAKLYLLHRPETVNPMVGFIGSSNLTFAGLSMQGELNIDVKDDDTCKKLSEWFDNLWRDRKCIDISDELAEIIEDSWASDKLVSPYHVYLKIAYHLSREARHGQSEFRIPRIFEVRGDKLFDFQVSAVKVAAHHLNKRGGVIIGDVVGLGKTLMASALLKIIEETDGRSLIICPKNLFDMWNDYVETYELSANIVPLSQVEKRLPELRRYRTVLIDESHNLRNRDGKRYKAIEDYIRSNDSRCILLSATPYNKSFIDLSSQLRLFIDDGQDIGIRPEAIIRSIGGETEFALKHQCPVRSIVAFEKSDLADDWRDLMRLYMIRRTRGFIIQNYAETDSDSGRKYLLSQDDARIYFPARVPKTVKFEINENDSNDQYARAYSSEVCSKIENLKLPRYGLGNYIAPNPENPPTSNESKIFEGLGRAGVRLKGFCRTNLFKRLESGGPAFIQSIERHIMRNLVFLHAIENGLTVPIGSQDTELLDVSDEDIDSDATATLFENAEYDDSEEEAPQVEGMEFMKSHAANVYTTFHETKFRHFKWVDSNHFTDDLAKHLKEDVDNLAQVLSICGQWDENHDKKLKTLVEHLHSHKSEKVLIFTQFADTARYLESALVRAGIEKVACVTGSSENPTRMAWRFSPSSNDKHNIANKEGELNVLITTDVLSEGQNLQDCSTVINFDLPWAIIRLIQRVGRVDRIGQKSSTIQCYTFLPADGVEQIINLRSRVNQRLTENKEVIGSDEAFFEGDDNNNPIQDLYSERAGILDAEEEGEVDLASQAYEIWNNATKDDAKLRKSIEELPDVVFATKAITIDTENPEGVLVYVRTPDDIDALVRIDSSGEIVTQSPLAILKSAECLPKEEALVRANWHHDIVGNGITHLLQEERSTHGALGRSTGARYKTYNRLKLYLDNQGETRDLFFTESVKDEIEKAMDEIYNYPLFQSATDTINRHIRTEIEDKKLVELVLNLRSDGRLSIIHDQAESQSDMRIICSMGLKTSK